MSSFMKCITVMMGVVAMSCPLGQAVVFEFINEDGPGEGLNDPTVVAAVGGNTATTLGAQRMAALERVGEIWGRFLVSEVPIVVNVQFNPLGANVLAAAGPARVEINFPNAPLRDTLYPVALANSLARRDLRPAVNDINVTVSSDANFYLGFNQDGAAPGSNFIDTLLHEVGHGLGFLSFVDEADGSYLGGFPDVFSSLIFDVGTDRRWPELTAAERVDSAVSGTNLAWDGPATTAGANQVLELSSGQNRLVLDAVLPDLTRLGDRLYRAGSFAPRLPARGVSGMLVVTDDGSGASSTLACEPLVNGAEVAGNIAFVRRGVCSFDDKVFHAQEAGAVAVVVANNVDSPLISPTGDGIVDGVLVDITIPMVLISRADGDALEAASPGVRVDFSQRLGTRAGSTGGRVNLFAPSPAQPGSSLSHWTTAALPNLLMEPAINDNLDRRLDLTLTQMRDIGWGVVDIPFPHESYAVWAAGFFQPGEALSAEGDDADGDGATNVEEYFFGTVPTDGGSLRFPEFSLEGGVPEMELVVSTLPADLRFVIETTETLEDFTDAVVNVDVRLESRVEIDAETERLVFSLLDVPERRFARVRIEQKDP